MNNVLGALERIINTLKHFNKPPDNGIAIFAGNISKKEGETDIKTYTIVPPDPIGINLYRCDSSFFLEPLLIFTKPKESYGLVAIDGKDATLALLEGKNTRIMREIHSTAPSKTHKGGQSALRYQRLVEEGKELYYKRVGEAMDESFLNVDNLKGIVIGGPGPIKEYFMEGGYFNYQFKVIGKIDTGYSDENGIHEMVMKIDEIIQNQEAVYEKKLVLRFIKDVVTDNKATYGALQVEKALEENRVSTLLVSEDMFLHKIKYKCKSCGDGEEHEKIVHEKNYQLACPKCKNSNLEIIEDENLIEKFEELAEKSGADIEFISNETVEGSQFLNGFYGVGAFLRY
jgi:peptide chain release factor subunit 1